MSAPEPVSVTVWGELRAEKRIPARRLGARAASRVHWSERATRLVARVSRTVPVAWAEGQS